MKVIIYKGGIRDVQMVYRALDRMEVKKKTIVDISSVLELKSETADGESPVFVYLADINDKEEIAEFIRRHDICSEFSYQTWDACGTVIGGFKLFFKDNPRDKAADHLPLHFETRSLLTETHVNGNENGLKTLSRKVSPFRQRILVKTSNRYKSVSVGDIAYFFTSNRALYVKTFDEKKMLINQNIDDIMQTLDDYVFFRVNRSVIVSYSSIGEIRIHESSRLVLLLQPAHNAVIFVSRERQAAFKRWLGD